MHIPVEVAMIQRMHRYEHFLQVPGLEKILLGRFSQDPAGFQNGLKQRKADFATEYRF